MPQVALFEARVRELLAQALPTDERGILTTASYKARANFPSTVFLPQPLAPITTTTGGS